MTENAVIVSGAPTENGMLWNVWCYACYREIGEPTHNPDELLQRKKEHRATHSTEELLKRGYH